jgi:Ca-activated chloride channel family protein
MRLAAVVIAVWGVWGVARAPQTFRASADVVHVPVVVTVKGGAPLRGLTTDDFEIREDGRPQKIQFFSEGASRDTQPLHLGLILDTSGSMQRDLSDAMSASIRFVNAVDESVDTTLVDFANTVRLSRFEASSYPSLFERIRSRKAEGFTALYDAVGVYLQSAIPRPGQHVVVVYSDGGDSTSTMSYNKLVELLRLGGNVVVYTIGYLENQSSTVRIQQQMRLRQMANETGGTSFFPSGGREIDAIYKRIVDELGSRYTLGYAPADRASAKFRKLDVKVVRPGVKDLTVRARTGYYAAR